MSNEYDKRYFNKLAKGVNVVYKRSRRTGLEIGFIIGHWYKDQEYPEYWVREWVGKKKRGRSEYEISYSVAHGCWTSIRYCWNNTLMRMESDQTTKLFPKTDSFYGPLRPALVRFFERVRKGMVYGIDEKDDGCKRWVLLFLLCFNRLLPNINFPLEMIFAVGGYLRYPNVKCCKKKPKKR